MLFIARYFQPRRLLEKSWQFVFSNCWKILKNWQSAITPRLLRMLFASEVMILISTPRIGTRDAVNLHSDHYEGFVSLWQSTLEICWLIKYFIFLHFPSVFQTSSLINWDAESHTRSLDNIYWVHRIFDLAATVQSNWFLITSKTLPTPVCF